MITVNICTVCVRRVLTMYAPIGSMRDLLLDIFTIVLEDDKPEVHTRAVLCSVCSDSNSMYEYCTVHISVFLSVERCAV